MIPYSKHYIDKDDIRAVEDVLKSDWLTTGPKVKEFEGAFAEKVGAAHAVACSSGTAALHLACLAGGVSEATTLVTSPITFVASANCGKFLGAKVSLVDVEPATICMNPDCLTELQEIEGHVCLVPVHYSGMPCSMPSIFEWGRKKKTVVIEDACHALGASYEYEGEKIKIGSCRHSDMTVFSFHPVKHITTGEGGMITTNSRELSEKLLFFRSHGIVREPGKFISKYSPEGCFSKTDSTATPSPKIQNHWYYEMHHLGLNYRLTDIQSALGISQLKKLDWFLERRTEIAGKYIESFANIEEIKILRPPSWKNSSWHLFPIQINLDKIEKSRDKIYHGFQKRGIGVQVHYIPVHYHPYYLKEVSGRYPVSEKYYETCISLPIYPGLLPKEQKKVIEVAIETIIN